MVKCDGTPGCRTLAQVWAQYDGKRINLCRGCLHKLEDTARQAGSYVKILDETRPHFE